MLTLCLTFNEQTVQMKKTKKTKKKTAIKDPMLMCDQPVSFNEFNVLALLIRI